MKRGKADFLFKWIVMKIKVLFLAVCTLGSAANAMDSPNQMQEKVIPSMMAAIGDTIKSDLGLGKRSRPSSDNSPNTFITNITTGARLYLYQRTASLLMYKMLSLGTSLDSISPQFNSPPSFFSTVIAHPILEELAFTYILGGGLGPYAALGTKKFSWCAKYIVPLLFGYGHDHNDPKTRMVLGAKAALGSFINISHIHANPSSFAPFIEHMINNLVAWYLLR